MGTGAEERVGTIVAGKYRLERLLGEGGFGAVYAGTHLRLERPVAIKILHRHMMQSADIVGRFVREARAAAKLEHPNVVDVRDVEVDEDGGFMVLELLDGVSLQDHLDAKQRLSLAETVEAVGPVLDALHTAHDAGIVHRDVKPDNVFLSRDRQGRVVPKLLDFGIAKLTEHAGPATATGAMLGTPYFMSPEQAQGKQRDIGPWTDVWAAAVMVYHCLCGDYPIEVDDLPTAHAILVALVVSDIVPLIDRLPDAPPALSEVLGRALVRDPQQRTASAAEFAKALEQVLEEHGDYRAPRAVTGRSIDPMADTFASDAPPAAPIVPASEPAPPMRSRAWLAVVALLAVAGGGGAIAYGALGGEESEVAVEAPPPDRTAAQGDSSPAEPAEPTEAPEAPEEPVQEAAPSTTMTLAREPRVAAPAHPTPPRPRSHRSMRGTSMAPMETAVPDMAPDVSPMVAPVTTTVAEAPAMTETMAMTETTPAMGTMRHRAGSISLEDDL